MLEIFHKIKLEISKIYDFKDKIIYPNTIKEEFQNFTEKILEKSLIDFKQFSHLTFIKAFLLETNRKIFKIYQVKTTNKVFCFFLNFLQVTTRSNGGYSEMQKELREDIFYHP